MDKLKAYLAGFKPDAVDAILVLVIVLYLFGWLPDELNNEVLNLKSAVVGLIFKNLLPQRLDDITKRLTGDSNSNKPGEG